MEGLDSGLRRNDEAGMEPFRTDRQRRRYYRKTPPLNSPRKRGESCCAPTLPPRWRRYAQRAGRSFYFTYNLSQKLPQVN